MRDLKQIPGLAIFVIAITILMTLMAGCGQKKAAIEKQKNIVRQIVEVTVNEAVNKGNMEVMDKFYAPTFVRHNPPNPDIRGLEAYKKYLKDVRSAFPGINLKESIEDMIAEGDHVVSRGHEQMTWNSISPTMGITTGKSVNIKVCWITRLENGKCVEQWGYIDWLGFRQQLGYTMLPPVTENTFASVTVTQGKPDKMNETVKIYKESVVPAAKSQKGFHGIILLDDFKTGKSLSISIWDSEADAIANEKSGYYKAQVDKFKDLFTAKPVREGYLVTVQE